MFQKAPNVAELRAFGLTPEDVAAEPVEVWPDNVQAFTLFSHISNQWRVGMNGPYALDYAVMFRKMDRLNLPPDEYDALEDDLRVMERAALAVINEKE